MTALQKALDESVPRIDTERIQRKHDELLEKYRDFLEKNNSLVSRSENFDRVEAELQQLGLDNVALKKSYPTPGLTFRRLSLAWSTERAFEEAEIFRFA